MRCITRTLGRLEISCLLPIFGVWHTHVHVLYINKRTIEKNNRNALLRAQDQTGILVDCAQKCVHENNGRTIGPIVYPKIVRWRSSACSTYFPVWKDLIQNCHSPQAGPLSCNWAKGPHVIEPIYFPSISLIVTLFPIIPCSLIHFAIVHLLLSLIAEIVV